jgi:hypothetical protein
MRKGWLSSFRDDRNPARGGQSAQKGSMGIMSKIAAKMGRKGGAAGTGSAKARPATAAAAANARWAKHRKAKARKAAAKARMVARDAHRETGQ